MPIYKLSNFLSFKFNQILKYFFLLKGSLHRMKEKAMYRLEEIICIYISSKSYTSKLIKNNKKLIVKYKQASGKKWGVEAKDLKKHLTKEDMYICGRQIKANRTGKYVGGK